MDNTVVCDNTLLLQSIDELSSLPPEASVASAARAIRHVRCEAMRELSRRMDNAHHAATWLIDLGVLIRQVRIDRRPRVVATIQIEHSPFVSRLFAGSCAWRERRQEGAFTLYTWFAVRYGCRIEWEERQCSG